MNEPTLTPEEVVPVSVPLPGAASHVAPPVPSSSDQLPTVRFQSLPPPLPPPRAPVGPAYKTQPLRAITREAALHDAPTGSRAPRRSLVAVTRQLEHALTPLRALWSLPWTPHRVGILCVASGATMLVASLVVGWEGVSAVHSDKVELLPLVAAVILARTALTVATMAVGYGLVRVGERTLRFGAAPKTTGHEVD